MGTFVGLHLLHAFPFPKILYIIRAFHGSGYFSVCRVGSGLPVSARDVCENLAILTVSFRTPPGPTRLVPQYF